LSEDDIPEISNVKCTGRFEGTGFDVVDVVETVSLFLIYKIKYPSPIPHDVYLRV
jgi:hypothetical protein